MDEGKTRKRERTGSASAKRILAHEKPLARAARDPVSAQRRARHFSPGFARKLLIILDSEKGIEIFGRRWKAF
jgi:hypothetical protein